ncbi:MAG: hypothetical protein ACYS4W_00270 [Planctomycetota bacterium]|jgi:hypothetical protein
MIRFTCENCGRKIRAPDIRAGHRGKCPGCKNVILVPQPSQVHIRTGRALPPDSQLDAKAPYPDLSLLDIPQKDRTSDQAAELDGRTDESAQVWLLEHQTTKDETEPAPKRKLPWLIDIFLYPISTPGLIIFAIVVGIPLLINVFAMLLGVFAFFVAIPGLVVRIVIFLYMYWYYSECIRDSADGGIRAPDVLANAPSLGDMFFQTLRIAGTLAFFAAPMAVYYLRTESTDTVFQVLLAYAVFFFPMGLLAVIMFDSFSGLNPILLIPSIFSTFFPYCAMVLVFFWACFLIREYAPDAESSFILSLLLYCANIYLTMVAAHILGWFYHRYHEKLNWEV